MPITEEAMMLFAEENDIETLEDLDDFIQYIQMLLIEPNQTMVLMN